MELVRPESAEQAAQALGNGSKALAGGTDLVPLLRDGIVTAETLIWLDRAVPRGVTAADTAVTVGAAGDRDRAVAERGDRLLDARRPQELHAAVFPPPRAARAASPRA